VSTQLPLVGVSIASQAPKARRAESMFLRRPTSRQCAICERIKEAGLCPKLCNECGGCFMPQHRELRSEAKRSIHRAEDCLTVLLGQLPGARS